MNKKLSIIITLFITTSIFSMKEEIDYWKQRLELEILKKQNIVMSINNCEKRIEQLKKSYEAFQKLKKNGANKEVLHQEKSEVKAKL